MKEAVFLSSSTTRTRIGSEMESPANRAELSILAIIAL